jgi:hypothetical protein
MTAATAATMASAATAAAAASRCKFYAGAKFSFLVEDVKGSQANIKNFLLSENNALAGVGG